MLYIARIIGEVYINSMYHHTSKIVKVLYLVHVVLSYPCYPLFTCHLPLCPARLSDVRMRAWTNPVAGTWFNMSMELRDQWPENHGEDMRIWIWKEPQKIPSLIPEMGLFSDWNRNPKWKVYGMPGQAHQAHQVPWIGWIPAIERTRIRRIRRTEVHPSFRQKKRC